jgi:hypothetical protein
MCFETKSSSSSSSSSKDKSSSSSSGGYNVTDTTTGKVTNYKSYDDAIAAANKIASDKGGSVEDRTTSAGSSSSGGSSSSKDKSSSETKTDYSGTNFNTAFKEARADLGPGQEFTYNGKKYSTATAEERPDLSGTTETETETLRLRAGEILAILVLWRKTPRHPAPAKQLAPRWLRLRRLLKDVEHVSGTVHLFLLMMVLFWTRRQGLLLLATWRLRYEKSSILA